MSARRRHLLIAAGSLMSALFMGAMLLLLMMQLGEIRQQRDIAKRQEGRVVALFRATRPTATRARRAQDELAAGLRAANQLVLELRRTGSPEAIAAAGDLARALERRGAPGAIAAAGNLADDLQRADAPKAIATAGDLARALQSAAAPRALADAGELARTLTDGDRAARLIDRLTTLTEHALADGVVDDVDATRQLTEQLATIAGRLDRTTRRTLGVLTESLAVQRETLERVESIDRRLGGAP